MNNYYPTCRYCGSIAEQSRMATSQEAANDSFSKTCSCGGYEKEKRHERMMENISQIFGEGSPKNGLPQVTEQELEIIIAGAESVFEEVITDITIGLDGSKAKVNMTGKGDIKIQRAFSSKVQAEA